MVSSEPQWPKNANCRPQFHKNDICMYAYMQIGICVINSGKNCEGQAPNCQLRWHLGVWSNCQKEGCKTLTSHFISLFKNCGWSSLVTLANFCSHKNLKAHALYYWAVRKYWEVFFHFRIRLFSYLGLHHAMYDLTVLPRWDPALWQGGEVSGAESLVESPQTWTSTLVHMNQYRLCTLCFPDADTGPGTCCYSCRPGTIYKEDENSKHKHVWFWWKRQLTEAQTKHPQRG